ncbi:nucleic acid/nucleotide deaminase domain-containing protein [Streptomyces sp. NPDC094032]|uniref:WXG100-like domain-containing protein n=1 Tax=Streptomyces sp. NPDC094032 TaxID=3155308 RepID=UPI003332CF50
MGKKLPGDLVEVLDLIGIDWPEIDEDEVRASAKDYRHLAEGIRDAIKEGNNACSHIVAGKSKGETVTAIDLRWGKLTTRDLTTFAKGCDKLAGALDECAGLIVGCKIAIITKLSATAAAATAGVIGMIFSAGLSALLSAAAIAAARIVIQEAIDYAVEEIASIVTDKIEAKVLAEIEKLFSDQLGGGTANDSMPLGAAGMAQDLVIEFDEFERAAGDYRKTAGNFDQKSGEFKGKGGNRKASVRKDSRFHKLAVVMDKAEDAVEKKADEMVKTLEDHGGKIDKSKTSHKDHDDDVKDEFEKCDDGDEVPMYLVNADGTVQQLGYDGTRSPLDAGDKSGIWSIVEPDGTAWRPANREKHEFTSPVGQSGDKVTSTKIDPGSTDLSRATEIARYTKGDYGGTNFAAGRYIDPTTGKPLILVGDSEGPHSERTIGYPLLKKGLEANLAAVYTERQPCQLSPKCDQWLQVHFKAKNPDLEVTYANSYDQSNKNRNSRDEEHRIYMTELEERQKAEKKP